MRENTPTLLSYVGQALGVPLGAIPLSQCTILRPYLLERHGISGDGTALVFAIPYAVTEDVLDPSRNLSVYAVAEDYHAYFKMLEDSLLPKLRAQYPRAAFALFSDHSPIHEVLSAAACGLGLIGDHGLLITPDYGSFVFLGEIITDLPWSRVTGTEQFTPPADIPRCEGCGACIAACPGQCLPDSRATCVSAISQKKGELTSEDRALLLSQPLVWGCDACQLACPHNRRILSEKRDTPIDYFRRNRLTRVDIPTLQSLSDEAFNRRAYAWRGRAVIERNLALWEERRKSCSD